MGDDLRLERSDDRVERRSKCRSDDFHDAADHAAFHAAFEDVLLSAGGLRAVRLLTFRLIPNHWHLAPWPQVDGDLSRFNNDRKVNGTCASDSRVTVGR